MSKLTEVFVIREAPAEKVFALWSAENEGPTIHTLVAGTAEEAWNSDWPRCSSRSDEYEEWPPGSGVWDDGSGEHNVFDMSNPKAVEELKKELTDPTHQFRLDPAEAKKILDKLKQPDQWVDLSQYISVESNVP